MFGSGGSSADSVAPPELPRYDFFSCPKCGGTLQGVKDNPLRQRFVGGPCKSRSCPSCGPTWTARHQIWFTHCLETADSPLFVSFINRSRWQVAYRKLKAAGADYVAIEVEPGLLRVVSTAPCGVTSHEVPVDEVVESMLGWVRGARPVRKPILASAAWRLPAEQKSRPTSDVQWVTLGRTSGKDTRDLILMLKAAGVVDPGDVASWDEGGVIHAKFEWRLPPTWSAADGLSLADWLLRAEPLAVAAGLDKFTLPPHPWTSNECQTTCQAVPVLRPAAVRAGGRQRTRRDA